METPLQTKRVNALFALLKTTLLSVKQFTTGFFTSKMTGLSLIPIKDVGFSKPNLNKKSLNNSFLIAVVLLSLFFVGNAFGQANGDYRTRNNGDWDNTNTWSKRVSGNWVNATDYPGQNSGAGVVTILDNDDVTLDNSPSFPISSLVIQGGGNDSNLTFSGTRTLNVTNSITIEAGTGDNDDKIIAVGSGTLNCGSMSFASTGNDNRDVEVTISTGTVTVSGNIVMNGSTARNAIRFSSTGLLKVGSGISGGSIVASSGTVEYYGNGTGGTTANQTIANYTYNNLETSGSGTKTLADNTTASGAVTVSAGTTMALSNRTLSAPNSLVLENGGTASTISGTGLLTLGGNVTVNKISGTGTGALISCPIALTNASSRTFTIADETTAVADLTISGIISTTGAIIKAGLGNMVQSGTNTYSGGTTINAGTISINNTSALGATTNNLSIASGAVANVVANVTVGNLTLGGSGTANGTWGFTGSGANYINTTYFTSTNVITVSNSTTITPTVIVTPIGTYTYNGSSQGPIAATNTGPGTSYTFSYVGVSVSGTTYLANPTPPTNAGSYTVTATVAAVAGFSSAASSVATAFTISPKALIIGIPTIASKIYDGTTTAGAVTIGILSSFIGIQTVTATGTAANYSNSIAGSYSGVVITYTLANGLNGGLATNYSLANGSATGVITAGPFVKMQILLPGETNAPGTPSGKTGTPNPQVSGVAFTATVSAVDAFWNVVSTAPANTISITTSDVNDTHPANTTLSSGTRTFSITLKTVGSSTVTATNSSDGSKTANTSTSVTVTPGIKATDGNGNWNDPNTWSPVGVPYFSDQVYIIGSDDVIVTANATCASINFTDENSSLSVNTGITLTVAGAVTLDSYNDDTNTSAEILGDGTLNADSLNVGLASILNNNDGSDNTLDITIATLNVTGDITIYNNDEGGGDANRPGLYINSPSVLSASKVAMIQTGDGDGRSRIITFDVDNGATVNLSGGPNPITISSEVDLESDHVDFDLGISSTINFNGSILQNIPALISNSRIGGDTDSSAPVNYGNLTITNTTTGTTTSVATGRTINVAGNFTNNGVFTATGSTVNFNGTAAQAIAGTTVTTFDDVTIGKTGGTLSVNTDATVGDDLTFTSTSGTLFVPSPRVLTVTDDLFINSNANSAVNVSITGTGTLNTSDTVNVGVDPNPNQNSTVLTTLNSSVAIFNIGTDLNINSYYTNGSRRNNGVFNLQSGILTINGEIDTNNEDSSNLSTFSMITGSQSGLLKLAGGVPFNLSPIGTNTVNLNGASAVVEYLGSVPQTALGTTYRTLKINNSNSGTGVTLGTNVSATTIDLTDGLLTTGANTMSLLVGGSINNASANSYVNGKLNRTFNSTTPATFPIGKDGFYSPVVFNYVSNTTKNVTIEQFETGSPFSSSSISTTTFGTRYWNITQSAVGTSYKVGLNDRGNTPLGSVVMLRKDDVAITYNNPTVYSSPNYTNSNAFTATVVSNDVALGETDIPLSITGVMGITNKMYDGNATATAIGSPILIGTILPGETVTLSGTVVYTFNTKNVGTGKSVTVSGLVLTGADAGAYSLPTNQIPGLFADITVRPIEVTANTNTKTFDNFTTSSTLPSITSGALQGTDTFGFIQTYDNKNTGTDKTLTPSGIVNDGNSGNNYDVTLVADNIGVINPKALTITSASTINKVYDGTDIAATTSGTWALTGVISPNVVTLNKSAVFASKGAGTWVISSTSTIFGADASNYTLTQPTLTSRSITKIPLTVTGVTASDKVYDGNRTATINTAAAVLNGTILLGETVTLNTTGATATFDTRDVGVGKTVTCANFNLDEIDANNYTVIQPTMTAEITARTLIITAKDISKCAESTYNFNGTEFTRDYIVPGDVTSVTLTSVGSDTSAIVGTYPIVASNAIGNGIDNYDILYIPGNLVINTLPTATMFVPNSSCLNEQTRVTFTGFNGTGSQQYKFYYIIDGVQQTITSLPGNSIATINVPTNSVRTVEYALTKVEDLNTGCSTDIIPISFNTSIGLCTQIRPIQCGKTLSYLTSAIQASPRVGATEYMFEVTRVDNSVVNTVVSPRYYFFPAAFIPNGLVYGKSYSIRVRVRVGGVWQAFGNTCIITAPNEPLTNTLTKIRPIQCGKTLNYITDAIQASPVYKAVRYEFEVNNGALTVVIPSKNYYFKLSQFPGGGVLNTAYTIRVRSSSGPAPEAFTAWGDYCVVSTPNPIARLSEEANDVFEVKSFPNPFTSHFNLDIESSSDDVVEIKVFDMIGRQLEANQATVSELSTREIGRNYPSGVYNVIVSQGNKVKSIRMIKR